LRRKGLDRFFSAFGLRPVRCLTCGRKSYIRIADKDLIVCEKVNTPMSSPLAHVAPVHMETTSRHAA
jgi:hypothetical protein